MGGRWTAKRVELGTVLVELGTVLDEVGASRVADPRAWAPRPGETGSINRAQQTVG